MSKIRYLKSTTALLTVTLMSSFSMPAIAQDADDDNVDVIYVTGH